MKVLLSIHEIDLQKVHDLGLIADILNEKNIEAGLDTDLLIELSDYAVKGKYTFIHEDINNPHLCIQTSNKICTEFPPIFLILL